MAFNLSKIFAHTDRDPLIRELTLDSRNVRPGDLFLAVPGINSDGRAHMSDALKRGAAAVAYEVERSADHRCAAYSGQRPGSAAVRCCRAFLW